MFELAESRSPQLVNDYPRAFTSRDPAGNRFTPACGEIFGTTSAHCRAASTRLAKKTTNPSPHHAPEVP